MQIHVLLYNVGTSNEGIHTIQIGEKDIVLMFESEDDATRYAVLLEAQDFHTPSVEQIDSQEIEDFCAEANYECRLINKDMLAVPPETNVEKTDWSQEGKKVKEKASMSESELESIRRKLEGLL